MILLLLDLRKRSTLSEGEEPEVHFPFKTNPFDKESLQPKFSGQSIFVSPDPSVFNNNNNHKGATVVKELCSFGDGFVEKWSGTQPDTGDPDYDPVFMSLNGEIFMNCFSNYEHFNKIYIVAASTWPRKHKVNCISI